MPRRRFDVPPVSGIDLAFTPASYWDDADAVGALTRDILGEQRRRMVADVVTGAAGAADAGLDAVDERYLASDLPDEARRALGRLHPSFLGGEYLPTFSRRETEIARVVLDSVTMDVFSLRARRARNGRLHYRLVDEYDGTFRLVPASSREPLPLRAIVHMLDTAEGDAYHTFGEPLPIAPLASQRDNGEPIDPSFVTVSSTVYPQLGEYYDARIAQWIDAARAEGATIEGDAESAPDQGEAHDEDDDMAFGHDA